MSVVWRLISVAALLLSAGVVLFSIVSARQEQKVRPRLDLLRLGIALLTVVLMSVFLGVDTPEALMGAGLLGGVLVGLYEGLHLRVRFLGRQAFARRTVVGLAAWGAGVLVVQLAGVLGRVGAADFGLTISFFGIGQIAGLLTGRWQSVLEARRARVAGAGAAAATLGVLLLAAGALPGFGAASAAGQTEDLGGGDVQITLRWSSPADLDLSVTDPAGETVSYGNRAVSSGGQLDRDANFPCDTGTTSPVENVFWPPGGAPYGSYRVGVTYRSGCGGDPAEAYELTVRFGGEVVWEARSTIGRDESVTVDLPYAGGTELAGPVSSEAVAPVAATDDDADNRLWDCGSNPSHRAAFGDAAEDRARCFSFRYAVPAEGIRSAVVYVAIEVPTASLQETDSMAVAVGQAFPEQCGLAGDMAGCVTVHGGFQGGERSLTVNLLDLACDPSAAVSQEMQEAVRAQLGTGVLHVILQDDTAVLGARLALNEGPPALACGTSAATAPLNGPASGGDAAVLSADEGAASAAVGLGGSGLLLVTALAGSGNSVTALAGAWRGGRLRGLRELAAARGRGGSRALVWRDPATELSAGRAAAALEGVPEHLRVPVREAVAARLEAEEADRLADLLGGSPRPGGAGAHPGVLPVSREEASGLLSRLPAEARERVVVKLGARLPELHLQGAVGLAADAEGLGPGVDLDTEVDLAAAVRRSGRVGSLWAGLPEEVRVEAEGRLVERLEAERLGRWVERLRPSAARTVEGPGKSWLDGEEARRLLAGLPSGLRDKVREHASGVLEREAVRDLVARAKRAIERARAVEMLREAFGAGDGDAADAVVDAAGAALDLLGEVDVDDLVRGATGEGIEALRSLPRAGGSSAPADLTGHLLGEEHLLAAVRRVEGVQAVLGSAGGLRPRVEEALVQVLDAERIERVVDGAAREVGPAATAVVDVLSGVRDLPGVRSLFARLAGSAREQAYRLLGEHLRAAGVQRAADEVSRAVVLDRAEEALRGAAAAGDIDAADRALVGLGADEVESVSRAALGDS